MIEEKRIKQIQILGNEDYKQSQHLNCFEYSRDGKYFALGDQSGCLFVFQYDEQNKQYITAANFIAHEQQHDQQKNQVVECRVSNLKWLNSSTQSLKLLTSNHRFIKIWRLKDYDEFEFDQHQQFIPTRIFTDKGLYQQTILLDYKYTNEISHLDISKSDQYIITATKAASGHSIQKWYIQEPNKAMILWQRKRQRSIMQSDDLWDRLELMCALKFHQPRDNCFAFSTKFGQIQYHDSRFSYHKSNVLNLRFSPYSKSNFKNSPFTKFLQVVSDFKFLDNNILISRDYLNIYAWDLRKPQKPTRIQPVFPQMIKIMSELVVSNRLEDRFKIDAKGSSVITNFYGNTFHYMDLNADDNFRVTVQKGDNQTINKQYALKNIPLDSKPHELHFNPTSNELGVIYNNRMDIYNY